MNRIGASALMVLAAGALAACDHSKSAAQVARDTAAAEHSAADTGNLRHAADIWFSVRKHWCIELQRAIRARRSTTGAGA